MQSHYSAKLPNDLKPNCQVKRCQIAKWYKKSPSQCKGDSTIYLNSKLKESIASWEFVNTTMSLIKDNLYWFSVERVSKYKS